MSTAAEVGHALAVLGASWTGAWLVGDAVRGWSVTRRVGRRVLDVLARRPRLPRPRVTVDVEAIAGVTLSLRRDALARQARTDRRARRHDDETSPECYDHGGCRWAGDGCRGRPLVLGPGDGCVHVLLDDRRPHPYP